MSRLWNVVSVLIAFVLGFVGYLAYVSHASDRSILTVLVPSVECDSSVDRCRQRLRAQAELFVRLGDMGGAAAVLRRLARLGDPEAAFHLAWHYEERYRTAVGRLKDAATPIREAAEIEPGTLPTAKALDELIDRRLTSVDAATREESDRAFAFLWYARAATAGFAPALNNLAAMHQFGLLGVRDDLRARRWYLAAYDAGSPVAAFNLERLRVKGREDPRMACLDESTPGWLPLVRAPAEVDMRALVLARTRFRGRELDPPFRALLAEMVLRLTSPEVWIERASRSAFETENSAVPSSGGWEYDDEDPAERKTVPVFVPRRPSGSATDRLDCSNERPDPRKQRIRREEEVFDAQMARVEMLKSGRPPGRR